MDKPWWNRSEFSGRRQNLVVRSQVLAEIRRYFADSGFIEIETPALQVSPGLDRHTQPLKTVLTGPFEAQPQHRYLHTSPEFAMKKLLAAGEAKIFQICHVFRDGEDSKIHHPEFTLLEWYRAGKDYRVLMADIEGLLEGVAKTSGTKGFQGGVVSCEAPLAWSRMTIAEAFRQLADIDVAGTIDDPVNPSGKALVAEAQRIDVRCNPEDSWDDVFHKILLEKVEPHLANQPCIFLTDYPTPVGALARRTSSDPRFCERVEAYVCGMELANGYSELTDAVEQRTRFERDRALHASLYGDPPPIDEDFLAALADVPPSAGMALGIDRLVMLLTGAEHIRDVLWAPVDMSKGEG
jgi:lysyl-tRNA synthetase class 2